MSVDIDEQVRLLGLALERFVDDIYVDEVMQHAEPRSMVSVVADGGSRHRTNGSGRDGGPPPASHRHTPVARPARVRRRMVGVAACLAILVGVAGIFLVVRAPVESPSSPVPPTFRDPAWFEALAPLLPEGYDHVAIQQSHRRFVQFEAFNPASAKSLHITVTRTAMSPDPGGSMTLADAQDAPWTDPNVDHNISLPDGRQIGLFCTFRPMPDTEPECPDVNGDHTDPEMLRSFALTLASDLKPEDLPPVSDELDHVSIDTIRAAIGDISTSPDTFDVEAPHLGVSFVQHGDVPSPDFFTVRTVTGFYPPFASDTPRTSASAGKYRLTWQPFGSDAVWSVSDSPANGLDVADSVLDRAGQPWGDVPTRMPDGYAIWNVTSTGSSGEIRPLAPDAVNDDQEISWGSIPVRQSSRTP